MFPSMANNNLGACRLHFASCSYNILPRDAGQTAASLCAPRSHTSLSLPVKCLHTMFKAARNAGWRAVGTFKEFS